MEKLILTYRVYRLYDAKLLQSQGVRVKILVLVVAGHDPPNCTWSDEVASDIRCYLEHG